MGFTYNRTLVSYTDEYDREKDGSPAIQAAYIPIHPLRCKNTRLLRWELPWTVDKPSKKDEHGEDLCGYIRYGVRSPDGEVTPRYKNCTSVSCPHRGCRISWMRRRAERGTARIAGWMALENKEVMHLTLSPPQDEKHFDTLEKYKIQLAMAKKHLKRLGIESYSLIFHPYRQKARAKANADDEKYVESMEGVEWEWGPHFHVVAPKKWIDTSLKEFYADTGYVAKILRPMNQYDLDELNRVVFYELTHVGVPVYEPDEHEITGIVGARTAYEIPRLELVRWFGDWSKRKLQIVHVDERVEDTLCPVTGRKMRLMVLDGYDTEKTASGYEIQTPKWSLGKRVTLCYDFHAETDYVHSDFGEDGDIWESTLLPTYTIEHKGQQIRIRRNQGALGDVVYTHHSGQQRTFKAIINRWEILKD